jgi:ELMO domain-containing protein
LNQNTSLTKKQSILFKINLKREKINKFKEYITEPYDEKNEKHEKLLMLLWKVCFPNVELKNRISNQWKDIGFQGTNPSTDFRGVGVFGLWNIIYYATTCNIIS